MKVMVFWSKKRQGHLNDVVDVPVKSLKDLKDKMVKVALDKKIGKANYDWDDFENIEGVVIGLPRQILSIGDYKVALTKKMPFGNMGITGIKSMSSFVEYDLKVKKEASNWDLVFSMENKGMIEGNNADYKYIFTKVKQEMYS